MCWNIFFTTFKKKKMSFLGILNGYLVLPNHWSKTIFLHISEKSYLFYRINWNFYRNEYVFIKVKIYLILKMVYRICFSIWQTFMITEFAIFLLPFIPLKQYFYSWGVLEKFLVFFLYSRILCHILKNIFN